MYYLKDNALRGKEGTAKVHTYDASTSILFVKDQDLDVTSRIR